jgi:hypothetical protein
MLNRSDKTGSLIELSLWEEQFKPALMKACSCPHSASLGVDSRGVKSTCRPGDTRDVNGGVEM